MQWSLVSVILIVVWTEVLDSLALLYIFWEVNNSWCISSKEPWSPERSHVSKETDMLIRNIKHGHSFCSILLCTDCLSSASVNSASGTMLHMTLETMTGIHVTLFNLVTMTDKMFSSSYITASTDVIVLAAAADLLLQSTQSLSSVASGSDQPGHD